MDYGHVPFAPAMKTLSPSRVDARGAMRTLTLLVVIALAVVLGVKWAFTVPIFQNPDEIIHADYAFALMDAGRIEQISPDPNLSPVDPLSDYLLRTLSTGSIAFHPGRLVEPGYGTADMFWAIDTHAPIAEERAYHDRPIPTHLRYPFLYYGLIALVGTIVRNASNSVVATVFAMRLFGVALLATTLLCGFALLRKIGYHWVSATAVTAIVGLLPEQSFLSASIQPDNLAQAAVTATLLCAVLFRGSPRRRWLVATGILLGVLYMTKLQYFVAVAIPVVLLILSVTLRRRVAPMRVALGAVALFAPTACWYAIKWWMSRPATISVVDPVTAPAAVAAWEAASRGGPLAVLAHLVSESLTAWRSFYFDGNAARSFWGNFGWLDTPLVIGNGALTTVVDRAIGYVTVIVVIAVVVSAIVSFARIARRIRAKSFLRALAVFAHDPMIFTVLIFNATMLALWLRWGDFSFQGRYWLPLAFPIWYVAFSYAPRLFRRPRLGARVAACLIAAVLLLVNVEVGFALPTIVQRYYLARTFDLPNRQYLESDARVPYLIEHATINGCALRSNRLVRCAAGSLQFGGWAIPNGPLSALLLTFDGQKREAGTIQNRADVAAARKLLDPAVGFELVEIVPPGHHHFSVSFLAADGATEYRASESYDVIVTK